MAYLLGELLEDLYRALGQNVIDGTATGGSTTTIVDSTLTGIYNDGDFVSPAATAFIGITTDGAAPQGEFQKVSDYVDSSGTLTIAAITAAAGSGDKYAVMAGGQWKLETLIKLVNEGLRMLGRIPLVDTSLTTATETLEYDLPLALKGTHIQRVQIQGRTDNANANEWLDLSGDLWYQTQAAPGTQSRLIFKGGALMHGAPDPLSNFGAGYLIASRTLKLWYHDIHTKLATYDDAVSETIHPELALMSCKVRALEWKVRTQNRGNKQMVADLADARALLNQAKADYRPQFPAQRISNFIGLRDVQS